MRKVADIRHGRMKLADMLSAAYNPRKDLQPGDREWEKIEVSLRTFGTERMKIVGTGGCFKSLRQSAGTSGKIAKQSFYGLMQEEISSKPDYYKRLFGKGSE